MKHSNFFESLVVTHFAAIGAIAAPSNANSGVTNAASNRINEASPLLVLYRLDIIHVLVAGAIVTAGTIIIIIIIVHLRSFSHPIRVQATDTKSGRRVSNC